MSATTPSISFWEFRDRPRRDRVQRGIVWSDATTDADDDSTKRAARRSGERRGHGHRSHRGPDFEGRGRGRRRASRGDVRNAVLAVLAEEPQHGYAILGLLAERSGGLWRPSPGSVYPILGQLEDEGLVTATETAGRRVFSLTDAGRAYVEAHSEQLAEPWHALGGTRRRGAMSLADSLRSLGGAVREVTHNGTDTQLARAVTVLDEARRSLYRILAEDETNTSR
jgi:DNA-binding PadR family transcriptional regulator